LDTADFKSLRNLQQVKINKAMRKSVAFLDQFTSVQMLHLSLQNDKLNDKVSPRDVGLILDGSSEELENTCAFPISNN